MNRRTLNVAGGSLLAAGLVAAVPAAAQQRLLEEVVVTARKVEESLQETPLAVSAYTADMLEALTVTNVGDLVAFTPGLTATSGPTGGKDGYYFIRGVGQLDSNAAIDPGVATYIDGVYLGRIQGASFDTLDVERIEVLRGPQGTLFGRNAIGGAINVISKDPGDKFGVTARLTGGSRDRIDGQVSIDLPVSDTFGLKLSALSRNQDGWGERTFDNETFGDIETLGVRIKAMWEPTEDLTIRFSADYTDNDGSPAHTVLLGYRPPFVPPPAPPGITATPLGVPFPADPTAIGGVIPGPSSGFDLYDNNTSAPARNELEVYGFNGTIDWDVAGIHVKSITSYRELDSFHANDFDGSPINFFDGAFDNEAEQFSQEIQLTGAFYDNRINWLLGGFYFDESNFYNNVICLGTNNGIPGVVVPLQGSCLENNQRFNLDVEAWAAFAHATLDVTDRVTLTLGIRYTEETKAYAFDMFVDNTAGVFTALNVPPVAPPPLFPAGQITPTLSPSNPFSVNPNVEETFTDIAPKIGLDFQITDELLVYGSFSEGFKSGGFNGRAQQFLPLQPFRPETIRTFEVGVKSELFGNRMRLNMAGYSSTYEDLQILIVNPMTGFFDQFNAAKADIKGFEGEVLARPTSELDLMASVSYIDAGYDELDPLVQMAGVGFNDPLPMTPEWSYSVGAAYTFRLGELGTFTLRADYSYTDEVCFQAFCNGFDLQDGVGLTNIRGTWRDASENLSVSVFGLNVTDEEYLSNSQDVLPQTPARFDGLGVAFAQVARPAEWGVELQYRYGY